MTNLLYDPLGFVGPVVLSARLLYSEICREKFGWDEPLPSVYAKGWSSWLNNLTRFCEIKIPRCYRPRMDGSIQCQLHFFSDASNVARGTVCYLRMILPDSLIQCSFIMGKSHTGGPNRSTIPRLELEAALDAVKLSLMVKQELEVQDCPCFFWTDSCIVLHSLHADCKRFSLFPRNRLQRILSHTKVYDWGYINTKHNPADNLHEV